MTALSLTSVTLCAVTSRAVEQTVIALTKAMACAQFADAILVTHERPSAPLPPGLRFVQCTELKSREDYSHYLLRELHQHISTPHAMVVQWDGYPIDPTAWTDDFLRYDYIGAVWPQFPPERSVGNGGFSLRSRRLLELCASPRFRTSHPEDICICHQNRSMLEEEGIKFADPETAAKFSFERQPSPDGSFGFHGVFNLIQLLGREGFEAFYQTLDPTLLGEREALDLVEQALAFERHDGVELAYRLLKRAYANHGLGWRMLNLAARTAIARVKLGRRLAGAPG